MANLTISAAPSATNAISGFELEVAQLPAGENLASFVEATGIDDFVDRHPKDRAFAPTMEHGFGLSFRNKEYNASDPYIKEHGIRREATEAAINESPEKQVRWKESIGVFDVGGGIGGAIPIYYFQGAYVAAYFGFYGSTMLRYRRLSLEKDRKTDEEFEFPSTVEKAMKMKKGYEVELVGQGRVNTGTGIMAGIGVAISQFSAGAAAVAPVTHEGVKELSLTVTAIDGKGRVRVIVRRLDSGQHSASLWGVAGLVSPGYNGPDLDGDGNLLFLAGNTSTVTSTNLMLQYTSAGVGLTSSHLKKSTVLSAFDLDLNVESGAKAYKSLLRLSTGEASRFAKKNNSGVKKLVLKEKQIDSMATAEFNFFGEKLFLAENVDKERKGHLLRRNGSKLNYREKIFEKSWRNIFLGAKKVSWEAAKFKDDLENKQKAYFHLSFDESDFEFVKSRFDLFIRFAHELDIEKASMNNSMGIDIDGVRDLFLRTAKVDTKVDIFFTNDAVNRIAQCKTEQAMGIYLKAKRALYPDYFGLVLDNEGMLSVQQRELLERFSSVKTAKNLFGILTFRDCAKLRSEYHGLTGRKIEEDAELLKEAKKFAEELSRFKQARAKNQAEQFFSRLGKMRGFRFMAAVLALRTIAGKEHVLVQELSLSGRKVRVGYDYPMHAKGLRDIFFDELTTSSS